MASPVSFQGLSTNIQTDQLVEALLMQQRAPMERMENRKNLNTKRASLIRTIRTNIQSLNTTLSNLSTTAFENRKVTSSDADNRFVSATATGATTGAYDVQVHEIAKRARLTSTNTTTTMDQSLGGTANVDGKFEYTLTNRNGESTVVTLDADKNNLAGLRDAINAKSADTGMSATVIQTAASGNAFSLVMSSADTGLGTAATNADSIFIKGNVGNALGFAVDGLGSQSAEKATNADFSVNGLRMQRSTNTITDAVEGMSFTLKGKSLDATTTLSVNLDTEGVTAALNDVVSKFNAIYKVYKDNSAQGGVLANDFSIRSLLTQTRQALMGTPDGLSADNEFQSAALLGLKTARDGTMSVDSTILKESLENNIGAAGTLFGQVYTKFQEFSQSAAGFGESNITSILRSIDSQNLNLTKQIDSATVRLEKRREILMLQFANLEKTVGQLQSMGQSLGGLA